MGGLTPLQRCSRCVLQPQPTKRRIQELFLALVCILIFDNSMMFEHTIPFYHTHTHTHFLYIDIFFRLFSYEHWWPRVEHWATNKLERFRSVGKNSVISFSKCIEINQFTRFWISHEVERRVRGGEGCLSLWEAFNKQDIGQHLANKEVSVQSLSVVCPNDHKSAGYEKGCFWTSIIKN